MPTAANENSVEFSKHGMTYFAHGGKVGKTPLGACTRNFIALAATPPDPQLRGTRYCLIGGCCRRGKKTGYITYLRPLPLCCGQIGLCINGLKSRLASAVVAAGVGTARAHPAIVKLRGAIKTRGAAIQFDNPGAGAGGESSCILSFSRAEQCVPFFLMGPLGPGPQARGTLATFLPWKVARPKAKHSHPRPAHRQTLLIHIHCPMERFT